MNLSKVFLLASQTTRKVNPALITKAKRFVREEMHFNRKEAVVAKSAI